MNKQARHYIWVSVSAILGIAAVVWGVTYLKGVTAFQRNTHYTVIFDDARGLSDGAIVRMSGVAIGSVDRVRLTQNIPNVRDNLARMDISIRPPYRIPTGSRFVIKSSLLGNSAALTVEPNPRDGPDITENAVILGEATFGVEDALAQVGPITDKIGPAIDEIGPLLAESKTLVRTLQARLREVGTLTGDAETQRNLKRSARNLAEVSEQLPGLLRQTSGQINTLSRQTQTVLANANRLTESGAGIAANAEGLTGDLRATVAENRQGLQTLVKNAGDAASSVAGLTEELTLVVGDQDVRGNLKTATANLASISTRLDAVTADLQKLSGDPKLNADVRATVTNLRETSASIRNLAGRAETIRLPGERRGPGRTPPAPAPSFSATSLLEPGLVLDSVYDTTQGRLRVDTNYTLLGGGLLGRPGTFYRVGLYDLSGRDGINLQYGQTSGLPAGLALRYGLIAGKLGLGGDVRTGPLDFRLDLFDPNRLTVNARAKAYLNRDSSVTVGLDGLGRDNRATVGVQIRR